MCGFTGCISFEKIDEIKLEKSNRHSYCRGPDNTSNIKGFQEIYFDLWFNRLAIVDLSSKANQPMVSEDSNSIIMFNGEIYNSKILRNKISKHNYKFQTSHSDTETLFAGLNIYGIEFINEIDGQFSFFYLNKLSKKIYLARDRVGQKPLYFKMDKKNISFASNLKSILDLNNELEIDRNSVNQYLAYGTNFAPRTLFKNIYKIPSGNYIEIDYEENNFTKRSIEYWNPESFYDDKEFKQGEFEKLFAESVAKRMIADVEIANFLSGGIDSTSIVKNLSDLGYNVNTFSVLVGTQKYNEKKYIQNVVNKYKTNHKEVVIDEKISRKIIKSAIASLDEPYGDPSIVPTYYLSKLISKDYKVAISGDGGDELLGGYYRLKNHLKKKNYLSSAVSRLYSIYPSFLGTGSKLKSLQNNAFESYLSFLEDEKLIKLLGIGRLPNDLRIKSSTGDSIYKKLLSLEYKYYLSDQMMFKIDRASMSNSIEVRSPLVDHKLVEYIFSHSYQYFNLKNQKQPLQKYLSNDFTLEFLNRPKQGFVFDYRRWVFSNFNLIKNEIKSSKVEKFISSKSFFKLNLFKTRINALRIWRLYVLACYLNETSES
jgi:asparagine synthase (glutamine-hydrolysing)